MGSGLFLLKQKTKEKIRRKSMKNMKTAAGMLCLAGILSLGMGTTVFAEDGDSHYPSNNHNLQL